VYITAGILPDNRVVIQIRDRGCGIPDVKQAMEPLFTTAPEEERAGLGFAVMESLMDRVRVTSHPGKGTCVTLTKRIRGKEAGACRGIGRLPSGRSGSPNAGGWGMPAPTGSRAGGPIMTPCSRRGASAWARRRPPSTAAGGCGFPPLGAGDPGGD